MSSPRPPAAFFLTFAGLPAFALLGGCVNDTPSQYSLTNSEAGIFHSNNAGRPIPTSQIKGMNEHGHFSTWSNPVTASRYFPDSMKEINPAEGTKTVRLDLTLDPGAKLHLRVVDQQGKPVTGVKTGGRRERGRYD